VPAGAPATLTAPLLSVHGLNSGREAFQEMHDRLSTNPNNQFGGVCRNGQIENANPQGNHFAVEFSSGTNRTDQNAQELAACTQAVSQLTQRPEVDVVAHSQGGLAAREAAAQPGENIRKIAMIGTPNHGTDFANGLGQVFPTAAGYIPSMAPRANGNAQGAVDDLRPGSATLNRVNQSLPTQRQNAEMMTITGTGAPTTFSGGQTGDGVVPSSSVPLPGVPNQEARNCDHLGIHKDRNVQDAALGFLAGRAPAPQPLACTGTLNSVNEGIASLQASVNQRFEDLLSRFRR
jgi:pimeloyl-ACP methyl ester carboxylesterase